MLGTRERWIQSTEIIPSSVPSKTRPWGRPHVRPHGTTIHGVVQKGIVGTLVGRRTDWTGGPSTSVSVSVQSSTPSRSSLRPETLIQRHQGGPGCPFRHVFSEDTNSDSATLRLTSSECT